MAENNDPAWEHGERLLRQLEAEWAHADRILGITKAERKKINKAADAHSLDRQVSED